MRSEVFDIENFNILSDEENYYFFRALNMGDLRDLESGLTIEEATGAIAGIRTDRARYVGKAMYTEESEVSLEEMVHHIKMHHRKDTNCISLTSNANAAALYGRGYYKDRYAMIRVPKKELGNIVFNAGQYMVEEISRLIDEYIQNNEIDELTKYYLDSIDNAQTEERLREITDSFKEKQKEDLFKRGITYKVSNATSVDYQALNKVQNLEKNKLIAKLNLLQNNLLPNISNRLLIQTLGNAFSSLELINYKEIPKEKITEVPKELIDILALVQQLPYSSKVQELKKELIDIIINKRYQTKEFIYTNNQIDTTNEYTIEHMYNLTNGNIDFDTSSNIYKKAFYLAKSKLRTFHSIRLLSELIDTSKYQDLITSLLETYGVEPDVFSRQSSKKMQISESVSLDFDSKEKELFEYIDSKSEQELIEVLNNPTENLQEFIKNSTTIEQQHYDKNTYYANAIFDLFDWDKLDIMEISDRQRKQIIDELTKHNIVEIYNQLKQSGIKEKDIATVLLTTIIKGKKSLYTKEVFTVEELENFLGYYEINNTKGLKLRPYQVTAVENIDKIHETHNFAATVMPTGAGKSFVALTEMLKYKDEPILYLAPNETILNQIKKYILKYICPEGLKEEDGVKYENDKIKQAFPNLTLSTYQSLLDDNKNEIFNPKIAKKKEKKYSLIIFDELHRTGAKEWKKSILELLKNQDSNTKILGVSATPERDMDGVDMADYWAEYFGYTEEEIILGKHLAMNMDLEEAIENGYVINPRYVQCDYMLEQGGTLASLKEKIEELMDEELKRAQLAKFDKLRKRVLESAGVDQILGDNLKPGGRYIVFCPVIDNNGNVIETEDGRIENERFTGEDIIEKYQKQLILNIIKYRKLTNYSLTEKDSIEKFMKVANELGLDFYSILGTGTYSKSKNRHQLDSFEQNDDPTRIKFINAINILNEGVHLDKVDGIIWLRPLDENSKILYLQQLGRIIYGVDSFEEIPDEEIPVVIDLVNNKYRVNMDKKNKKSDLDKLVIIKGWIDHTNRIPNNNSSNRVESNHGRTLKRIQEKYIEYLKTPELINNLTKKEQVQIKEILRICTEIDLWSYTFEDNVTRNTNSKTKSVIEEDFQITGIMKDYYDLKKEVDELNNSRKTPQEWVQWVKEYCETTGLWPSHDEKIENYINLGYTQEEAKQLRNISSSLYDWLSVRNYLNKKRCFDFIGELSENGIPLKDILDELYDKYAPKKYTPQDYVIKIKEYCEKTGHWISRIANPNNYSDLDLSFEEKQELARVSKRLFAWLCNHKYYAKNETFDYIKEELNGISLKEILDELRDKYAQKKEIPQEYVRRIKEYCEKTKKWPSMAESISIFIDLGYTKEEAKKLKKLSRSLYQWLSRTGYTSNSFDFADEVDENGIRLQKILDDLKHKMSTIENNKAEQEKIESARKVVKEIEGFCRETSLWPTATVKEETFTILGFTKEEAAELTRRSKILYCWMKTHGYIADKFEFNDALDENGKSLFQVLNLIRYTYDKRSKQYVVNKLKKYCEETKLWPSDKTKVEKYIEIGFSKERAEELVRISKSLAEWLTTTSKYTSGHFKYSEEKDENGRFLKDIIDELKANIEKIKDKNEEESNKTITTKSNLLKQKEFDLEEYTINLRKLKSFFAETGIWIIDRPKISTFIELGFDATKAEELLLRNNELMRWFRRIGYVGNRGKLPDEYRKEIDELKRQANENEERQKEEEARRIVRRIKDYCEETGLWLSRKSRVEKEYVWLQRKGYFEGDFKYGEIKDENGIPLQEVLDNLRAIYFGGNSTQLTTEAQHYNLKKSSTSKNLLSKLYYLIVQFDLSYKSNDTEKYNSLYKEINNLIQENNLNIDINKINELITLDEDKKYELCLSEYMHSSIQNNLDNAELYKALYNYYSVVRYGVNTLTSDIKL